MNHRPASVESKLNALRARLLEELPLEELEIHVSNPAELPGHLEFNRLQVSPGKRQQGVGSRAIQEITRFADEHDLTIWFEETAQADPGTGTTSKARLQRFYLHFGFVRNEGATADPELAGIAEMYRPPSASNPQAALPLPEAQHPVAEEPLA